MASRKRIPAKTRQAVYLKYRGRCAYCGEQIAYKEMQVDHQIPLHLDGEDNEGNYMPACRACNYYKSTMPVDKFREQVRTLPERLRAHFIYRLARKYGIVVEMPKEIQFYYETTGAYKIPEFLKGD